MAVIKTKVYTAASLVAVGSVGKAGRFTPVRER
jgi:hypothetical protein